MNFEEALKQLVNGEYAQRKVWESTGEYVVLMPGMLYLWKILTQPNPNAGNYMPSMDDFLAVDWNVVPKVALVSVAAPDQDAPVAEAA